MAHSTNTLFTGRDDLLNELETTIRDAARGSSDSDQCRIVISGMGGQGKSEICLQLAHRVRQVFWGVFWVDVSTTSSAENDFVNIASTLGISAQSLEEARQGLANVKQSWLLVLDNADDPDVDYQCYFPAGPSSVVMLTSHNAESHQYASTRPVELEGLPDVVNMLRFGCYSLASSIQLDRGTGIQLDRGTGVQLNKDHLNRQNRKDDLSIKVS